MSERTEQITASLRLLQSSSIIRICAAVAFLFIVAGCASPEETSQENSQQETTVETTRIVEETVFKTIEESAEEEARREEEREARERREEQGAAEEEAEREEARRQAELEAQREAEREAERQAEQASGSYDATVAVASVTDGDTIKISEPVNGYTDVRLIGMDTPEVFFGAEPYGAESSAFATERLAGQTVDLELDVEEVDDFDRLLAYVWVGDELFNETLVREGYAQVATFPPNVKYEERFLNAQSVAQEQGLGIWGLSSAQQCELADRGNGIGGGCAEPAPEETPEVSPEPEETPTPSSDGGSSAPTGDSCPATAPIKGNDSSSGELIYHSPGGAYYDVTNPEECFATAAAAEAAGYRASQR